MEVLAAFIAGLFFGIFAAAIFIWRLLVKKQKNILNDLDKERSEKQTLAISYAKVQAEYGHSKEYYQKRIDDLGAIQERLKETFASLSKDTLVKNIELMNASFKATMDQLQKNSNQERLSAQTHLKEVIAPLKESLLSMDKKVSHLESAREGAYSGLKEQIEGLLKSQVMLQNETHSLAKSLQAPSVRGRWGEMQLRRVVELSGLSQFCDFVEQLSVRNDDELLRPDMVVTLPRNKKIIIDAKAPLDYMAEDEASNNELVATLKRHLLVLKKKSYAKIIGQSPEFTVMFLPNEAMLHRALATDPTLLDFAAQNEIIMATPLTLIALLKAVAFGFKQESVAQNIEEVRKLAQELIDRVNVVAGHFEKLGKSLKNATECYNQTLASLDSRVLVTARKLSEIKSFDRKALEHVEPSFIETIPKEVSTRTLHGSEP